MENQETQLKKSCVSPEQNQSKGQEQSQVREEKIARIKAIIDEQINPILEEHMGGLVMTEYTDEDVLWVRFTGACGSCYAAEDTLDGVVRDILWNEMPEIKDIQLDDSVDEDLLDFARSLMKGTE